MLFEFDSLLEVTVLVEWSHSLGPCYVCCWSKVVEGIHGGGHCYVCWSEVVEGIFAITISTYIRSAPTPLWLSLSL